MNCVDRCMICLYGPPVFWNDKTTIVWNDILQLALHCLTLKYPYIEHFSLSKIIYPYVEAHWDLLYLKDKVLSRSSKTTAKMTLSRFSYIYCNGYDSGHKRGTWALLINYNGYIELPFNCFNGNFPCDILTFEDIDIGIDLTVNKHSIKSITNSENIDIKPNLTYSYTF